jgi:CRISPR/Cas system CMR subunit Cmr6 (Cas7 group RAMP superfamily)
MCYDWIDKSQFFIGIITRQYRPIVEKEIKYVLKKKKERCLIYIKNECFQENSLKLKSLIKFIGKKVTYHKFDDEITLRRVIPNQIADLIGKYAR